MHVPRLLWMGEGRYVVRIRLKNHVMLFSQRFYLEHAQPRERGDFVGPSVACVPSPASDTRKIPAGQTALQVRPAGIFFVFYVFKTRRFEGGGRKQRRVSLGRELHAGR